MMLKSQGFTVLSLLCCALMVGGCASAATAEGMTVRTTSAPSPDVAKTVSVTDVVGGSETHPFDTPKIDNTSFRAALTSSLRDAGLLADGVGARFKVVATLVSLQQPMGGI